MTDENPHPQAQATSSEPAAKEEPAQPREPSSDRSGADTVDSDNPLICRGID
ncbi:MAG: hypothetical protein H6Q90_5509 [Deltaproteobacteria bacterium]|nr:hypothetical protein [Deltaproteobacteria bacterium]